MEKVALKIHDWEEEVDVIVTSPYVRARQTAEIMAQVFNTRIVEAPELVPESPCSAFLKWLKAHGRSIQHVMVVGHDPHIGRFLSYLVAGREDSFVNFKKSGAACLEIESFQGLAPGTAQLNWLIQPRLIVDRD